MNKKDLLKKRDLFKLLTQSTDQWNKYVMDYHMSLMVQGKGLIDMTGLDFRGMTLSEAKLTNVNLSGSNCEGITMNSCELIGASLSDVRLKNASLFFCNFTGADLVRTDLSEAHISFSIFVDVIMEKVKFDRCKMSRNVIGKTNMSDSTGLESINHQYPSVIDFQTLQASGELPRSFLRGIGLPDDFIDYLPSFQDVKFKFHDSFISYSHIDIDFARKLHDRLQEDGIRCWRDEKALKPGDKIWEQIDWALRAKDRVILVCSKSSLNSWWVEDELIKTFTRERIEGINLTIPITLDGEIFDYKHEHSSQILRRYICDFRGWNDNENFEAAYNKLKSALISSESKIVQSS